MSLPMMAVGGNSTPAPGSSCMFSTTSSSSSLIWSSQKDWIIVREEDEFCSTQVTTSPPSLLGLLSSSAAGAASASEDVVEDLDNEVVGRHTKQKYHSLNSNFNQTTLCTSTTGPLPEKNVKKKLQQGSRGYKHVPHKDKPAQVVAKRNARERRRVQAVNGAFVRLRKAVPVENVRGKRISKVKTLQNAIDYIHNLQKLLEQDRSYQPFHVISHYYYHRNDDFFDDFDFEDRL